MRRPVWISYDLGLRGDYESLYTWLDAHEAQECGDSLAFIRYEYKSSMRKEIRTELASAVKFNKSSRVYIVYLDDKDQKYKGAFIVGGRKAAPWTGYAASGEQVDADEG